MHVARLSFSFSFSFAVVTMMISIHRLADLNLFALAFLKPSNFLADLHGLGRAGLLRHEFASSCLNGLELLYTWRRMVADVTVAWCTKGGCKSSEQSNNLQHLLTLSSLHFCS